MPLCAVCALAQPAAQSIVNAASYSGALAPGALASIFGTQLAPQPATAGAVPLPYSLGNVSVTVGGLQAPLLYVSATQINLLIPFEAAPGASAPVVVTTPAGSAKLPLVLGGAAPAIFTSNSQGAGAALAFDANFQAITALTGAPIVLYATGLGPTNPPPASSADGGSASPPYNTVTGNLRVTIGELPCAIGFAGLAPGLPGVYQLNVTPPANPQSNRLYLSVNGIASNAVTLPVPVGRNVTNLSGTIQGLYPATGIFATLWGGSMGEPLAVSEMLTAATIGLEFDILPGAQPFTVIATSPAGNAVFQIDPAHGTCEGSSPAPYAGPRVYDFGGFGIPLYNLQTGAEFPGDITPAALIDTVASMAIGRLPYPTNLSQPPTSPNGVVQYTACPLNASGHFAIGSNDGQPLDFSNYGLFYGGFFDLGKSPAPTGTVQFALLVDGVLVASQTVPYQAY